jgi:hypothetical protein
MKSVCLFIASLFIIASCAPVQSGRDAAIVGAGGAAQAVGAVTRASAFSPAFNTVGAVGAGASVIGYIIQDVRRSAAETPHATATEMAVCKSCKQPYVAPANPTHLHFLGLNDTLVSAPK